MTLQDMMQPAIEQIIFVEFHNKIGPKTLYKFPEKDILPDQDILTSTFSADYGFAGSESTYSVQEISIKSCQYHLFSQMMVVPDQYQRMFVRKFAVVYVATKRKLDMFRTLLIDISSQLHALVHNALVEVWERDTARNQPTINALQNDSELRTHIFQKVFGEDYNEADLMAEMAKLERAYEQVQEMPRSQIELRAVEYLLSPQALTAEKLQPQTIQTESNDTNEFSQSNSNSMLHSGGPVSEDILISNFKQLQLTKLSYQVYRETHEVLMRNHITAIKNVLQRVLQFIAQPLRAHLLTKQFQQASQLIYVHAVPIYPVRVQPEPASPGPAPVKSQIYLQIFRPDLTPSAFEPGQVVVIQQLQEKSPAALQYNQHLTVMRDLDRRFTALKNLCLRYGSLAAYPAYYLLSNKQVLLTSTQNSASQRLLTISDALALFRPQFVSNRSLLNLNYVSRLFTNKSQIQTLVGAGTVAVFQLLSDQFELRPLAQQGVLAIQTDTDAVVGATPPPWFCKDFEGLSRLCDLREFQKRFLRLVSKLAQQAQIINFGIGSVVEKDIKTTQGLLKQGSVEFSTDIVEKKVPGDWKEYVL